MAIRSTIFRSGDAAENASFKRAGYRRAFTLTELLIVLAIMAAFSAIVMPRMLRAFGRSQLQRSAQQLAEDLSTARLLAIEHGVTYEVHRDNVGEQYFVRPRKSMYEQAAFGGLASSLSSNSSQGRLATNQASQSSPNARNSGEPRSTSQRSSLPGATVVPPPRVPEEIESQLDPGVTFSASSESFSEDDSLEINTETQLGSRLAKAKMRNDANAASRKSVNDPLGSTERIARFFSDGRSESTSIKLYSSDGFQIELKVRRLTGGVQVGPVQSQTDPTSLASGDPSSRAETLPSGNRQGNR